MAQKFKYVGEQEPVDIPALGLVDVTRGTHVEVDDPETSKSMHSSDAWEHIPDKSRSRAAKKAAAKRAAPAKKAAAPAVDTDTPTTEAQDAPETQES